MEIVLKVMKFGESIFRCHVFSESLLSSVESALLALEEKKTKLQILLSKMIELGDDEESEDVLFVKRRLVESSEAYNDLLQLYLFLREDGV